MALVEQWNEILSSLPPGWSGLELQVSLADEAAAARASALLAPLNPLRSGGELRLFAVSRGVGPRPDAVERAMRRLDRERIAGRLELVETSAAQAAPQIAHRTLADDWDPSTATLPSDWSDLYLELALDSSDDVGPAALAMSPLNPRRAVGASTLRFRAARLAGYGASPGMVRRCLERCDAGGIRGELGVLRVLCDTKPVGTQGPVWQIGGRTV